MLCHFYFASFSFHKSFSQLICCAQYGSNFVLSMLLSLQITSLAVNFLFRGNLEKSDLKLYVKLSRESVRQVDIKDSPFYSVKAKLFPLMRH